MNLSSDPFLHDKYCIGSNASPSNILQASAEVAAAELAESSILRRAQRTRKPIKVDTYFHVLAENKTIKGGWVPKDILKSQLDVLQKGFGKLPTFPPSHRSFIYFVESFLHFADPIQNQHTFILTSRRPPTLLIATGASTTIKPAL